MDYSLTLRQAKEAVHKIWTGPKALKLVPLLIGDQGVAKSAILGEVSEMIGLEYTPIFIAQHLPEELVGIVDKDREKGLMVWLKPEWTANAAKRCFCFDEVNRGDVQTRNALMQVPLYRQLHLYKFPDESRFCAAMNPDGQIIDGANYQVEGMDRALETRFCPILVRPDRDEWFADFGKPAGVHPLVMEFLEMYPEHFHYVDKDGKPSPSPRSWERVSDLVHTGFTVLPFFYRHLGVSTGTAFCTFARDRTERLTIGELLEDYGKMKKTIQELTPAKAGDIIAQVATYVNEKGMTEETKKLLKLILGDLKADFRLSLGSKIKGELVNQFVKADVVIRDHFLDVIRASKEKKTA